jgi:hypothetical protein
MNFEEFEAEIIKKAKKKELIKLIISLVLGVAGAVLCLIWYDSKLLLIWFLLTWGENISRSIK